MSAVDDLTEAEYGPDDGLVVAVDRAYPCCTLCNDSARWENDMVCICMGFARPRPGLIFYYIDEYA